MTDYNPNPSVRREGARGCHSHHHHHRHDGGHESIPFKNNTFLSKKRRKVISDILFVFLTIIAALIMIAVIWLYTVE